MAIFNGIDQAKDPQGYAKAISDWAAKMGGPKVPTPASSPAPVPAPSAPTATVPKPSYNVNDPTFLNMSAQDRLNAFGTDKNLAQQEILRDKSVYGQDAAAGNMAGANAAHSWADQVRQVSGISNEDPTYGNANVPAPSGFIPPQKATGGASAPIPQPSVPAPQVPYGQLSPDQIAAEAKARIDAQRAALQQSVDATKTGLKNTYDYNNQILADNRNLENQQFKRNNSPFTGQTDYLTSQLLRNRSIQDTASQKDYAAAVAAADQKLNDFNAMAPEQQQAIMDQLTQLERNYGLQVGQLTGNLAGYGPTLAKQAQDAQYTGQYGGQMSFPAMMQMAQMTGQLPGGQNTMQRQQMNIDNALKLSQLYGTNVQPADSGSVLFGQVAGKVPLEAQQQQLANLWNVAQQTGTIPDQLADAYGIPRGTKTADYMLKQAQANYYNDHGNYYDARSAGGTGGGGTGTASVSNLIDIWKATNKAPPGIPGVTEGTPYNGGSGSGGNKPQTAIDFSKFIDDSPYIEKQNDGTSTKVVVNNPDAVESMILTSGLPESEMIKLYQKYLPGRYKNGG